MSEPQAKRILNGIDQALQKKIISGWIEDDAEQKRRADALLWLLDGGGGHEDGVDGLRAMRLTAEGLIDFLSAYQEHLQEKWAKP